MNSYIRPGDSKLMQRYLNWAAPYYERFSPEHRMEAVEFDRWLYSRQSLGFLLGVMGSVFGLYLGLKAAGIRTSFAILTTGVVFGLAFIAIVGTGRF